MIIYLALEDLDQRYTKMMNQAFEKHVDTIIRGEQYGVISNGQFLDTYGTSKWKADVMSKVSRLFLEGLVGDGDKFIVSDLFWPGVEAIKYMSELSDMKVDVYGYSHAGRADKTDFVHKLGTWSDCSEAGWYGLCTKIFCGSQFHANLIGERFGGSIHDKTYVTGAVWDLEFMRNIEPFPDGTEVREDRIVFSSRTSWEKGWGEFLNFAIKNPNLKFFVTSGKKGLHVPKNVELGFDLSKKEYYRILKKSKWFVSFAYQETFGYSLQEAILYGCNIAVPDRCCYPEMVPLANLYKTEEQLTNMLNSKSTDFTVPFTYTQRFDNNVEKIMEYVKS